MYSARAIARISTATFVLFTIPSSFQPTYGGALKLRRNSGGFTSLRSTVADSLRDGITLGKYRAKA